MRVACILGEGEAFYHILSRIVDRRLIFDDVAKERFRDLADLLASERDAEAEAPKECLIHSARLRIAVALLRRGSFRLSLCSARRLAERGGLLRFAWPFGRCLSAACCSLRSLLEPLGFSSPLKMAERGGFEPPVALLALRRFSKPLL